MHRRAFVGRRYSADFDADAYSFQGLFGYKVIVAMGLIFGDGLYSLTKILVSIVQRLSMTHAQKQHLQKESEMSAAAYAEGGQTEAPA